MNNSVSEQSFYIESEDDDAEENELNKGEDDGNDSDSSDSSAKNQQQNRPNSYNTSWPQSYRQSIDMLSSVHSPNIGFLGTPSLTRLGSSFLSSASLIRRSFTPDTFPSATKPLLPTADEQRLSSHSLLPHPKKKDEKPSKASHELPYSRECSNSQSVLNGMNVLCGVGILSTPYAAKEGGWLGLSILVIFALLSYYTGLLLRYCLDSEPGLETYPDIGHAAFGTAGRIAISIVLYVELYVRTLLSKQNLSIGLIGSPQFGAFVAAASGVSSLTIVIQSLSKLNIFSYPIHGACCIEYIILESDNLSSLFPNAHLSFGGFELNSHVLFAVMTALAVLPTVWLRDMSILSYISAGGVIASVLVVICLLWVGAVDQVGFHSKGTTSLNLATLPVAVGLYGYCYSGHAVFPNIYTSMAKPNQYPAVLFMSFGLCTLMYAGVSVMGYLMFGDSILSQFTLNMPKDLVATKIALWTTVVNPFTKYALTISPVAMSLEELIPSNRAKSHIYAIFIRTALVFSTLVVGLSVPFFGLVMSLIGSFLTMLVTLILPCLCFLSILRGRVSRFQGALCVIIITVGVVSSGFGTYSALSKIIESLRS